MYVWTTLSESDLYDIADEVGVSIAIQQSSTETWRDPSRVTRSPIPKKGRAYSFGLRPARRFGKKDGDYLYQRTSSSYYGEGRRVFAVCWHGHRDFMLAIFARDENARIKSHTADYRGREDFMQKYPDTAYRNVGSMMAPMYMSQACKCGQNEWIVDTSDHP